MRSVSVKELKDDLTRYLDEVQAGKELVIKRKNKTVAKIIPFGKAEDSLTDEELEAHVLQLAAEGRIHLGKGPVPKDFFDEPLAEISANSLVPLIIEDRDEE